MIMNNYSIAVTDWNGGEAIKRPGEKKFAIPWSFLNNGIGNFQLKSDHVNIAPQEWDYGNDEEMLHIISMTRLMNIGMPL
jgi:hypothetical protein